jgi:hypothetical protein
MVQIEYLPVVLTGIGIIVSILYYTSVLRNANKTRELQLAAQQQAEETRQAQLFMNIYSQSFADKEWNKAYRKIITADLPNYGEYSKKYDYFNPNPADPEFLEAAAWILSFYEGLGVFVKQGLIDINSIALTMTGATTSLWEKFRPFVYIDREKFNSPRALSEFEYLYDELMKHIEEHPELSTQIPR